MGYLPQYNSIDRKFPITVEEVILSGLSSQKSLISRFTASHREKARQVIARMGLEGLEERAIGALSGGQLQRALLGRAIISDPQLVVLDEPSTYIDKRFEARLYELLAEINHDCAIILVSHDIGTVLQQVKSIACVNETLDYHPDTGVSEEWLERNFNCPIELLGVIAQGDTPLLASADIPPLRVVVSRCLVQIIRYPRGQVVVAEIEQSRYVILSTHHVDQQTAEVMFRLLEERTVMIVQVDNLADPAAHQLMERTGLQQIGRASCRERV